MMELQMDNHGAVKTTREVITTYVRWYAIALAIALVIGFTFVSGWAALLRHEILGTGYLPRGVVPLFLLLVTLNSVVKLRLPSVAFTKMELVFVFIILLSTAAISGQEFGIHFYLNLLGLVYYSSPQSQWFGLFTPHLPSWLVPSLNPRDPPILWAFEGMPDGAKIPLGNWFVPLLLWTPYLFSVYAFLTCFSGLIARQWEERERLLYPLTQVPLELSGNNEQPLPRILKSPIFWLGFTIPVVLYSLRGLHLYFPTVPDPQLQRDAGILFPSGPMAVFNGLPLHFYPEMVGIAYLLSREVGFSLWFFCLLRRAEEALRIALGIDMGHSEFFTFQSVAAYIVMATMLIWTARYHFRDAWRRLFDELRRKFSRRITHKFPHKNRLSDTWALYGILLSFVGLLIWAKIVAGVSILWVSILLLGLTVVSLVVARVVSEAGIYIYSAPFRVYQVLFDVFGKDRIGTRNVVLLSVMSWVQARSTATLASGYLANAFRLASSVGMSHLFAASWILVAILVTLLVCHVTFPKVIYNYSVSKLSSWAQTAPLNTANFVGQYLTSQKVLTGHHWWGLAFGIATCILLIKLRLTFVGFPLHPLGFITWQGWPINNYWLSIFIGWAIKVAVLHYGGYQIWYRFRPFFYGLIVGGTTTLTLWILLHLLYPTSEPIIYD